MTLSILLTGAGGQLGREIQEAGIPPGSGISITALDRTGLDVTDPEAIEKAMSIHHPGLVVNAAACTDVDRAESEPDLALAVNRDGPDLLARACSKAGIPLIHVSTDYVFDGRGVRPYREDDPVSPLNAYGRTKAEGEACIRAGLQEHVIIRTSWLYSAHGRNFLTTMLRLGREREALSIVDDQVGCPTWAGDLARAILQIAAAVHKTPLPWGTYHYCNAGETTWHGFARAVFDLAPASLNLRVRELIPIRTEDYPTPAKRPRYSVLDCRRITETFGINQPPWRESLKTAIRSLVVA